MVNADRIVKIEGVLNMLDDYHRRQSATGDATGFSYLLSPFSVVPPARNDLFLSACAMCFLSFFLSCE
jgi:hypothetical protein